MKVVVSFILLFVASISLAASAGFESLFNALTSGEVERDAARARLMAMSAEDLTRFFSDAKSRTLTRNRLQVVRAFDVLRRRADFDSERALEMKQILGSGPKVDVLEERLALFIEAKAGGLTQARIQTELQMVAQATEPSVRRLGRLTALTDAMQDIAVKPTASQLEALLKNDVFEIRMHAVDWFRLAPPTDSGERGRFLKLALASQVVQVRERAYRTIATWSPSEVQALRSSEALPTKCSADPSSIIRKACAVIQEKAKTP